MFFPVTPCLKLVPVYRHHNLRPWVRVRRGVRSRRGVPDGLTRGPTRSYIPSEKTQRTCRGRTERHTRSKYRPGEPLGDLRTCGRVYFDGTSPSPRAHGPSGGATSVLTPPSSPIGVLYLSLRPPLLSGGEICPGVPRHIRGTDLRSFGHNFDPRWRRPEA